MCMVGRIAGIFRLALGGDEGGGEVGDGAVDEEISEDGAGPEWGEREVVLALWRGRFLEGDS
jgi:hypothetical protein